MSSTRSDCHQVENNRTQTFLDTEISHERDSSRYHLEDYIRDVPVELFTVSKMVISSTNMAKENGEH